LLSITNPWTGKEDPRNAYKNWKREKNLSKDDYGANIGIFSESIKASDETIRSYFNNGSIIFFNGIGASLQEILTAIQAKGKGAIILLDYIQKMPGTGEKYNINPDLERIRIGSQKLMEIAIYTGCAIIAGAQFNRDSAKNQRNNTADDVFTDTDFRGCGDIEQDGHNLIGIGRSKDKTTTYYGIIKSREEPTTNKLTNLDFKGGYSYMANTNIEFIPAQSGKQDSKEKEDLSLKPHKGFI
jgi:hypothetical protein